MSKWELIDKRLKVLYNFLKNYINPFLTPFFTIVGYYTLASKIPVENGWRIAFLIVSAIYFVFTLGLAIFVAIYWARGGE